MANPGSTRAIQLIDYAARIFAYVLGLTLVVVADRYEGRGGVIVPFALVLERRDA